MNCISLSEMEFTQPLQKIVNENAIPLQFATCSFDNYILDDDFPSQKQQ